MAKKFPAVAGLFLIMLLGMGHVCRADDKQVHLKADHLAYDYDQRIVTADGNVAITYKDLKIHASHVVIAVDEDQLEADGDILVERDDEQYRGYHLSYDLKAEKGVLEPLNMQIQTSDMKAPIFGRGDQVEIQGDNDIIHHGNFTTCDLDDPHYHFSADELDYFPGDRLVLYGAVYYEGHVPLMYWPYLYISLKDDDSNFLMPVVGHDGTMGWFLILGYKFYFTDRWKGIAYLDWMSILGRRYRFQQTFSLGGKDKLTTEFSLLDDKVTDNNEMSYTLQLDKFFDKDWELTADYKWLQTTRYLQDADYNYVPTGDLLDNFYFMAMLKKTTGNPSIRFLYQDTASLRYLSLEPQMRWQPFKDATLNISGSWSESTNKPDVYTNIEPDDSLTNNAYSLSLNYTQKLSDRLSLMMNHNYSSNGKFFADDLALRLPEWKWGWFAHTMLSSDLAYNLTHWSEYDSDTSSYQIMYAGGFKWGTDLTATSSPIYQNKSKNFTVTMGWSLRERMYLNDYQMNDEEGLISDQQFAADGSINATEKFSDHLTGTAGLKWTQVSGFNVSDSHGLTEYIIPGMSSTYGLTYNNLEAKFNAAFTGAYNFTSNLWDTQTVTANWYPNTSSSMQLNMTYYPYNENLTAGFTLNYHPDPDTGLVVNYNYYMNTTGSLLVQADIKRTLAELWTVEFHTQYNVFNQYLNSARISISYDWHCRTLRFSYDVTRDQYVLEMVFDAFPSAPIGLGNQQDFFWNWVNEVSK